MPRTCLLVNLLAVAVLSPACWGQPGPEEKEVVFPTPQATTEFTLEAIKGTPNAYWLTYPSPIQTFYEVNNTVHARLLLPATKQPAPLVVILHALGVGDDALERRISQKLNDKGIAALILQLPYHISRTPPGFRSGQLMLQARVPAFKTNVKQTVSDLRRALDWAATDPRIDSTRLGVLGVSLGAIMASLAMAVDPRLQYAALLLGGADLAHIMWHSSLTISVREALRKQGFTEIKLREALDDIDPLIYMTPEIGKRTFLVGALFDSVVPATDTEKLHKALGEPPMLWLETGHYGAVFVEHRLLRQIGDFFAARFAGEPYTPPSSIHAPTLRFGLTLEPENGVQVAASLDLWRNNRRGDMFAAGLLSTRGPALFFGFRGPLGFSPGIMALPKRTVPALLWHFVL